MTDPRYLESQPDSQAGFLQGRMSRFWGAAFGYMKDTLVEVGIQGLQCRFIATCPSDALPFHSLERGLPRYSGDTTDGFRGRLLDAPTIWETGDTAPGLVAEFNRAGFANVRIEDNGDRSGFPPGHRPDGTPYAVGEEYWRFWVVIDDRAQHLFGTVNSWGGFGWGSFSWGFTDVPPNWQAVPSIIKRHKDSDSICAGIDIIIDGPDWGSFSWGDGSTWGHVLHISTRYR